MLLLLYSKLVVLRILPPVVSEAVSFTYHCLCDRVLCLKHVVSRRGLACICHAGRKHWLQTPQGLILPAEASVCLSVQACVAGMLELQDNAAFKDHLRDFLVQTKSFSSQDNADLFADEAAAAREVGSAALSMRCLVSEGEIIGLN